MRSAPIVISPALHRVSDPSRPFRVESQHGGKATLVQSVPVCETFEGWTVWEGVAHVFDLTEHPTATRAYAWSSPLREATSAGFSPCCIWGRSSCRLVRCERPL